MDPESQRNIKKIVEEDGLSKDQIVVVLGAGDIEGAEISAEKRAMFIAKGSLFLGRMSQLSDGLSFVLEANPRPDTR